MAKKEKKAPVKNNLDKEVLGVLQPIADALKVAVSELWSIFVRQYVVKGCSELFSAISLYVGAWILHNYIRWYALIPVVAAHILIYDAINLLGNPKYHALNDITKKMAKLKNDVQ